MSCSISSRGHEFYMWTPHKGADHSTASPILGLGGMGPEDGITERPHLVHYCKSLDVIPTLRNEVVKFYRNVAEWGRSKSLTHQDLSTCCYCGRMAHPPLQDRPCGPSGSGPISSLVTFTVLLSPALGSACSGLTGGHCALLCCGCSLCPGF